MRILRTALCAAAFATAAIAMPALAGGGHDHSSHDHSSHDHASHDHSAMEGKKVMAGDLHLSGHWTRAMLPGQKVGGGYVTITNNGSEDDRLLSATTPASGRMEIHEMAVVDDVMKMRNLPEGLPLPAGETVELKPGSYHLMFMEVEEPFEEGGMVPVVLTFEKAGEVELVLPIMAADTREMDHDHSDHGAKTN